MSFWKLTGPRKSLPNNTVYIFAIQTSEFCTHPQTRLWARICSNYIYQNPLPPPSTPIMWSLFPWENELVCISWTKKHSSTVCTTRLEAVHVSVSVCTTRCHSGGVHYLNTFEQVSSDYHQMSLVGGLQVWCPGGTLPDLSEWGVRYMWPSLCIWRYLPPPPTTTVNLSHHETITFPQL